MLKRLVSPLPGWIQIRRAWAALRTLSGDDAYERYLTHWQETHEGSEAAPLTRKEFCRRRLEDKWNGIKRCC